MRIMKKAAVLILCILLMSGVINAEESAMINGFRDYPWGATFEEVSEGLANEFNLNDFSTEVFDEEEQTEKNGIKDPTKYSIHIYQCNVAGYEAEAYYNFDEVGLYSGNYQLIITDNETSIRPGYYDLLEKLSTAYGQPLQVGEAEYGYGAIWKDQVKNMVFLDAYDGDGYKTLSINYWSADNPILGWIDSEMGVFWEESCGINLFDILNSDDTNVLGTDQRIQDQDLINPDAHDPFAERDDAGQPRKKETEKYDGPYAYKVGDTTVYTEHDLEQWIFEDPEIPGRMCFDIGSMLIDFWCQDNRGGIFENTVGFSYILDGENTKGVWFSAPDVDNPKFLHAVTVWHKVGEVEYSLTIRMYERTGEKADLILDNYLYGIDREMSVLLLYTLEQMEKDPRGATLEDLDLGRNFYCD